MSTEGDAFFAAFSSALRALVAAVAAQRSLAWRHPPRSARELYGPGHEDDQ